MIFIASFFFSHSLLAGPLKLLESKGSVNEAKVLERQLVELKEQNKALDTLLKRGRKSSKTKPVLPTLYFKKRKIQVGTALKGRLLNSIHSTNLSSPILVRVEDELIPNGKILCQGVTTHKRVQTVCTKLIFNGEEVDINVQLLNTDGSAGLVGEYEDKKEEMMEGVILDSTSQGFLSALSDRTATPFGDSLSRSLKNQLIQGSISGLEAS